jgi:hypothetical protein
MSEIRKLTKDEIHQAEKLAAALADCLDTTCSSEGIENFGVVSSAFLIILASLVVECLEEDEQEEAVRMFFEHVSKVIKYDEPTSPQIN